MPPPMIEQLFLKKYVAFAPSKERWMSEKTFGCAGTAYIIGRVCRRVKKPQNARILQVLWIDSQFQMPWQILVWRLFNGALQTTTLSSAHPLNRRGAI
ncbi:hypothetical protein PPTG_00594 [Phytophthora nicotianae INRA-310]|uniref:Uncharacterized protein n=1 Tax=Phytophthora nicotianae (strain INRA-310) TaxID=761204 RepID=W2RFD7_PHYN3|nr:hypothetical protein PPTG_00594 [Phytophthora nicotianae INRA-310]ETN24158.1 hypothetical protein PPTG_00594 [Phytophthora nicotianae INRA-310]